MANKSNIYKEVTVKLLLILATISFILFMGGCAGIVPGPARVADEENPIVYDDGFMSVCWWVEDYENSPASGILLTIANDREESKGTPDIMVSMKTESDEKIIKPLSVYLRVFDYLGDKKLDNPYDRIEYDSNDGFFILTGDFRSNWGNTKNKKIVKAAKEALRRAQIYYP